MWYSVRIATIVGDLASPTTNVEFSKFIEGTIKVQCVPSSKSILHDTYDKPIVVDHFIDRVVMRRLPTANLLTSC